MPSRQVMKPSFPMSELFFSTKIYKTNILVCINVTWCRTESSEMTDTAASITFRRIFSQIDWRQRCTLRKLNKFGIIYTNTKRYDDYFSGPMPCAMTQKHPFSISTFTSFSFTLFVSIFASTSDILAFRLNFQSDHLIKSVVWFHFNSSNHIREQPPTWCH